MHEQRSNLFHQTFDERFQDGLSFRNVFSKAPDKPSGSSPSDLPIQRFTIPAHPVGRGQHDRSHLRPPYSPQQLIESVAVKPIVNVFALLAGSHQFGHTKNSQMVTNRWLTLPKSLPKLAHAQFAASSQEIQDAETRFVS